MRAVRLAIAALVAVALAALPVAAALATPVGAALEASMSAPDDCPCCDTAHDRAAGNCHLKCCGAAAIPVEGEPLMVRHAGLGDDTVAAGLPRFSPQPDPPPPRS